MNLQLPKLSATMETGRIAQWCKQKGDKVSVGDILYELETDKTLLEVESTVEGILTDILAPEGEDIPTGSDVCVIRTADGNHQNAISIEKTEKPDSLQEKMQIPVASLPAEHFRASPSARRLASEWNVDIREVKGSGPHGRIRNRDIVAAVEQTALRAWNPAKATTAENTSKDKPPVAVASEITPMRRAIARELVRSQQTIPVFWVEKWVQAGEILRWREMLKNTQDHKQTALTVTDFLLQAVGIALGNRPGINRRWSERDGLVTIEKASGSHVGLAVSLEDGILVPVIEEAGTLSLFEIAAKRRQSVEAARSRSAVVKGESAVITLSNLGAAGVDRFRAIVRPDESMILAVGALQDQVVAVEGAAAVRKGFFLTLAADHRIIDGLQAAEFLADIASIIESGRWRLSPHEAGGRQ